MSVIPKKEFYNIDVEYKNMEIRSFITLTPEVLTVPTFLNCDEIWPVRTNIIFAIMSMASIIIYQLIFL